MPGSSYIYYFGIPFYSWKNYFLAFRLGDVMYFSLTFTLLLGCKETTLTKSLLLCERSVKFASKCKSLASNNEAILTYWVIRHIEWWIKKKGIKNTKIMLNFYSRWNSISNCRGTDVFSSIFELILLLYYTSIV